MLHELDSEEILHISGLAQTVMLKPGEFLFREGDDARALYVVKSGSVRVVSGSTVYETVRAGGIGGEVGIIEAEMPRSASVSAGTRAQRIEIDADGFLSVYSRQ